jgi:hypothetical protein
MAGHENPVMHFQQNLPPPKTDMLPSYRAACLAYRTVMQRGGNDLEGTKAAATAVLELNPTWTRQRAVELSERAVSFASTNYPAWFWRGRTSALAQP